jgi:hypothetical protein
MNSVDQVLYCLWRLELWSRNYGTYDEIDRDVASGTLLPGTMPDAYWRDGDTWRKQSEITRQQP